MTPVHILSKVLGYCLANLNIEECRNLLDALCLQDISQRHVTAEGIVASMNLSGSSAFEIAVDGQAWSTAVTSS